MGNSMETILLTILILTYTRGGGDTSITVTFHDVPRGQKGVFSDPPHFTERTWSATHRVGHGDALKEDDDHGITLSAKAGPDFDSAAVNYLKVY